jgi:ethanolamine permease
VPGAVVGVVLSLVALAATRAVPANRSAVIGAAIFFAVMIAYFALYSARRLVAQAPEEQVALAG